MLFPRQHLGQNGRRLQSHRPYSSRRPRP
ncbi:hypothetical protein Q4P96_11025, partial [Neisseria gonorrhoeae]|nr:hypothetical protein [Neisseria gonorrhoeae]MDO6050855.1 hypothetical protein [Neisseria gonorrhoeae]MDO6088476.1 hypothetical protein [Neisseria gonorrhoeae]MDO6102334.1 hypothetical protein [Neisseria gonorrhoeae]